MVKILYFMLLLSIVGGVCYVLAMRFLYFEGTGIVEVEKRNLSPLRSGTLIHLYKNQGERFAVGEVLAVVRPEQACRETSADIRPLRLTHEIASMKASREIFKSQVKPVGPEDIATQKIYRALEIGRNPALERESKALQIEQDLLTEKIALLSAKIRVKERELAAIKEELVPKWRGDCGIETMRALFSGVVHRIAKKKHEYVVEGAPLFTVIPDAGQVYIEAYFDWKVLRFIHPGELMTVLFPDKSSRKGKIVRYGSAAEAAPVTVKRDYLPVESKLRVYLSPLNESDRIHWKNYDRMDVIVTGERQ